MRRRQIAFTLPLFLVGLAFLLALGVVSCAEGGPGTGANVGAGLPADTTVSSPAPPNDMAGRLTGALVGGEVTATFTDTAVVLLIEATNLPDPREYAAYLYRGTCAESRSASLTLNPIVTLPDLTGSSSTVIEATTLAGDAPVSVRIHSTDGDAMACAELAPDTTLRSGGPSSL